MYFEKEWEGNNSGRMVSTQTNIQQPTKATTLETNKQAIQNRLIRI